MRTRKEIGLVVIVMLIICFTTASFAEAGRVRGYLKRSGAYVQPYHRINPDHSKFNNYSTKGNINPYTGKKGLKNPYRR